MRKMCAVLVAGMMVFGGGPILQADEHLVTGAAMSQHLSDAATRRADDLARLDRSLATARAGKAARAAGVDLARVRLALPRLSDGELQDLAQRASRLTVDPVAGRYHDHGYDDAVDVLVVVMVVAAVAAIVLAVADHY